jgi:hypothetical protein
MSNHDFSGKLVRLVRYDTEKHAAAVAAWSRDSEYDRLLGEEPAAMATPVRSRIGWRRKRRSSSSSS